MLPTADTLDWDALQTQAEQDRAASEGWAEKERHGVRVSSGFFADRPHRVHRSVVQLDASPDAVARLIANDMMARLGEWNREFAGGEVEAVLRDDADDKRWVMRVRYETPPFLANREYAYGLRRHDRRGVGEAARDVWITYQSLEDRTEPPAGYVRGALLGTLHRCVAHQGGTRLEHLLSTDLGGRLPRALVNTVFAGGMQAALVRDARAQREIFA